MAIFAIEQPVVAKGDDLVPDLLAIRHNHAGLAERSEYLHAIHAEAADIAERSGATVEIGGAKCRRSVFDQEKTVLVGDLPELEHARELAGEVHWQDRLRALGDQRLDRRRVDREILADT